jgi:hypothetical protein
MSAHYHCRSGKRGPPSRPRRSADASTAGYRWLEVERECDGRARRAAPGYGQALFWHSNGKPQFYAAGKDLHTVSNAKCTTARVFLLNASLIIVSSLYIDT